MRPLVCYSATSLDGYIAGSAGEIDWPFTGPGDQKQEPPREDFFNSLLGRSQRARGRVENGS